MATETPHTKPPTSEGIDLDEDLFNFDSIAGGGEDEESLKEVLAAFEAEPVSTSARVGALALSAGPSAISHAKQASAASDPHANIATLASSASVPSASPWLSRVSLLLLASVTALNALVAIVVMRSTSVVREGLEDVGSSMESTVRRLEDQVLEAARAEVSAGQALPALDAETHPALELAVQEIGAGHFARARQRIYSLLAIIDRLAPSDRDAVESRASFLLARTYHLEALARAGSTGEPAVERDADDDPEGPLHGAMAAPPASAHGAEEHR